MLSLLTLSLLLSSTCAASSSLRPTLAALGRRGISTSKGFKLPRAQTQAPAAPCQIRLGPELEEAVATVIDQCPSTDTRDMKLTPLEGGLSNILYLAELPATGDKVVARVYGAGNAPSALESMVLDVMSAQDMGPEVLCTQDWMRVESFIDGEPVGDEPFYAAQHAAAPPAALEVAELTARFHTVATAGVQGLLANLRQTRNTAYPSSIRRVYQELRKARDSKHLLPRDVQTELLRLERATAKLMDVTKPLFEDRPILCHSDLHGGNILRLRSGELKLLDYEYVGWDFAAYDLANFFNEIYINNHADTTTGFDCDISLYPNQEYQREFIRRYLEASDRCHDDASVQDTRHKVQLASLWSHLYWGLWGINQSITNTIPWGYLDYGMMRVAEHDLHLDGLDGQQ